MKSSYWYDRAVLVRDHFAHQEGELAVECATVGRSAAVDWTVVAAAAVAGCQIGCIAVVHALLTLMMDWTEHQTLGSLITLIHNPREKSK